jgi:hypothetical protein
VLTGGNDYYNNADGFNFMWEPKTNSFDVKVRVVSVSAINDWSAGAIEVREGPPTPNGGGWELARHYFCKVDYGGPDAALDGSGNGRNSYEYNCRLAPGDPTLREPSNNAPGGSGGWAGTGPGNPSPVPFPNAWIRIARVKSISGTTTNDHLLGYSSNDGQNWVLGEDVNLLDGTHAGATTISGNAAGPMPDVLYVGLGSTAHNNTTNNSTVGDFWYSPLGQPYACYVIYRDWGDVTPTAITNAPTLTFIRNSNGTVTLTYTGNLYESDTANGTYSTVSSASSPYTVTPSTSGKRTAFYRAGP